VAGIGVCDVELCGRKGRLWCPTPGRGVEFVEGALLPPFREPSTSPGGFNVSPFSFPLMALFLLFIISSTTSLHTFLSPSIITLIGVSNLERDEFDTDGVGGCIDSKAFM
jgi:hypothetical protein